MHSRSEGNAFFVEEVLRALIERGDVYRENGKWERREIDEIEVPESIRAVIGQRLGRLQPDSQEILREASVLGQTFDFEALRGMNNRSEEEVEAALEEASTADLTREGSGDQLLFNHALTQQCLYAELSVRKKRRLHIAAGEALERLLERQTKDRRSAELAWHFMQGDDAERALIYALKAGDEAVEIPAHGEAEQHYRTALELAQELGDEGRELQALENLGYVLGTTARYDEAIQVLQAAATILEKNGDTTGECRVEEWIGMWHRGRGTTDQGIQRVQEVLKRLEARAEEASVAALYMMLEFLFFAVGKYQDELAAAERAYQLASSAQDETLVARAEIGLATALSMLSWPEKARMVFERALPHAEFAQGRLMNTRALTRGLINAGCNEVNLGDINKGRDYFQRAVEVAERLGNPWGISSVLINLVELDCVSGEWTEALRLAQRALDLSRITSTFSWWAPYAWLSMGRLLYFLGEWEQATPHLQDVVESARHSGDLQVLRESQRILALMDLAEGRPAMARERLEPIIDRPGLEEVGTIKLLPPLALAYFELGDQTTAEATIAAALRRAAAHEKFALVDALIAQAVIKSRQKSWNDAGSAFSEALAMARRMPYPFAEALALFEFRRMELDRENVSAGKEKMNQALEIFEKLGAKKDIERVQRALAPLEP